jgi:hypothetical protein
MRPQRIIRDIRVIRGFKKKEMPAPKAFGAGI